MTYVYTRIADLEPSAKPQNFYGKVIFYGKHGETHVLLLKDETNMIYVWVKPKPMQELKFQLKQVVRVHRCVVSSLNGEFMGKATIGKAGCHLIAWSAFGKHESPKVISSKEWTKSKEDEERMRTLSELDREGPKPSVDEISEKMIEARETRRAEKTVASWARKVTKMDIERTRSNVNELFRRKIGNHVETTCNYPVDRSFFDDENAEEFVQFFVRCENCFEEKNRVVYVTEMASKYKCSTCKKKLENMEVAVRIRVECDGFNVMFMIPTSLIDGHENLPDLCTRFGDEYESKREKQRKMVQFCRMAQRKLWDVSLTGVKGHITGRSETLKFLEIFTLQLDFLDLSHE